MLQEQAGFGLFDAALSHVEEGLFIESADSRAVVALDIVGIDFEDAVQVAADVGKLLRREAGGAQGLPARRKRDCDIPTP